MNDISISFARGGFILTVKTEAGVTTEVFVSQAKLVKAVRAAIEDLSLVAKKGEGDEE